MTYEFDSGGEMIVITGPHGGEYAKLPADCSEVVDCDGHPQLDVFRGYFVVYTDDGEKGRDMWEVISRKETHPTGRTYGWFYHKDKCDWEVR